jgi:O-antigen ligase
MSDLQLIRDAPPVRELPPMTGPAPTHVVTLLSVFGALLMLIPSRLVLPGMGAAGSPATAAALGLLLVWICGRAVPNSGLDRSAQPARLGLWLFVGWSLVSYGVANTHFLTPISTREGDRALIVLLSMAGVALLAMDGLAGRAHLDTIINRFTTLTGCAAAVAILQVLLGVDPMASIPWPGLVPNVELTAGLMERADFSRPQGTAIHPIELSVVLAMMLPLAVDGALRAPDRARRQRRWLVVGLLGMAIPLTLSRSGVLGLIVGMGVLASRWDGNRRRNALVIGAMSLVVLLAAVPGMFGTWRTLIAGAGDDPSIQTRLEDQEMIRSLVASHPVTGIGFGTFTPVEYIVVDNQYYVTAVESGVPGLMLLILLLIMPAVAVWRVMRSTRDRDEAQLAAALLGGVMVAAVSLATFDGFAFRMFFGVLVVLIGFSGALWRLHWHAGASPAALALTGTAHPKESG